jgi:hypothetical protein
LPSEPRLIGRARVAHAIRVLSEWRVFLAVAVGEEAKLVNPQAHLRMML